MIEQHIIAYRRKGILVDTNLLLLLIVGATPSIKNFKRTNMYDSSDYELLVRLIDQFETSSRIFLRP
jgi:hypothetical protein